MKDGATPKELKQRAQEELARRLEPHGFTGRGGQRLTRRLPGAIQMLHLAFVGGGAGGSLSLILNLAVRHERVEDLAHAWRSDLSDREKKQTATLGVELGHLIGRGQMRWQLDSPEACPKAANDAFHLLREHGLPYLERYSDLEAVKERLSSDNPDQWHQLLGGRALRLPLVYGLTGEPRAAEAEIVRQYEILKRDDDLLAKNYPVFAATACRALGLADLIGSTTDG
jgi:hypothetical protein